MDNEKKLFLQLGNEVMINENIRLNEQLPILIEFQVIKAKAKLLRGKYMALLNEGFDKDQALELCKETI